jgi:hypothetical protein
MAKTKEKHQQQSVLLEIVAAKLINGRSPFLFWCGFRVN